MTRRTAAARPQGAPQNTPAWVDERRDVVGSSDIPILTGNSIYATSVFSLWAIKTRAGEPEPIDPETQELFDLGHALEDDIAERYTIRTGRPLRQVSQTRVRKDLPWAAASLDRVSAVKGERRIVELKWIPYRSWFAEPERVPAHVQDQVQWQLYVTGWDVAEVAVLDGGRVYIHEIGPNEAYQQDLLYIARWFRELVEHRTPPPIDGSAATARTLARLHPRATLDLLDPTPEADALIGEWQTARLGAKLAESEADRLANLVRFFLGDHEGVDNEDAGYRVSWTKNADSERVDWKLVAEAQRRMLEMIAEQAPQPVLAAAQEQGVTLPARGGFEMATILAAIQSIYTRSVEGPRVLRARFRNEETGKWS